jgi:hypothetical protein
MFLDRCEDIFMRVVEGGLGRILLTRCLFGKGRRMREGVL